MLKVKLKKGEAVIITRRANNIANDLIARYGLRKAFVIGKLVHEKVLANYKRMEEKYGTVT